MCEGGEGVGGVGGSIEVGRGGGRCAFGWDWGIEFSEQAVIATPVFSFHIYFLLTCTYPPQKNPLLHEKNEVRTYIACITHTHTHTHTHAHEA